MREHEVLFLEFEEVVRLHDAQIALFGGSLGIRDRGLLLSALAVPRTSVFGGLAYPTIAEMAAALAVSLARNHPFVDGNKRAAFTAMLVFLELNGFALTLDQATWLNRFVEVAEGAYHAGGACRMLA